jgi:D-alanyl-D-alanine carboxypeptidase/D-alanyl-D-alanine-endopeptidase (penicillin-binding protein 4)
MKKILTILILLGFASQAYAASLSSDIKGIVKKEGLSLSNQSFCIEQDDQSEVSINADMRIIPASVSKLYTFDFALSKLDTDFRYTTTFIQNKNTLYVNGGGDPHFVSEHMKKVLTEVRKNSKTPITSIVISPTFFFDWQSDSKLVTKSLKADKSLSLPKNVKITFSTKAYKGTGTKYEFSSAPLITLMKQMNNYSTNISTDTLFTKVGGSEAFSKYMKETYDASPETIYFKTGSGLSGNYTTCNLTLRVIKHLEETLNDKEFGATDILSMPQVDPGVLFPRAINVQKDNAIIAKSGFVNYNHTLAGIVNTKKEPVYFGLFTNYTDLKNTTKVKSMVDTIAEKVLSEYTLKSFDYTPDLSIFLDTKIRRIK